MTGPVRTRTRATLIVCLVAALIAGGAGAAFAFFSASTTTNATGTGGTLAAPTNFQATAPTNTTMHLSWTAPANVTSYTLSQSPGSIAGCSATPSSGTTSCDATGLTQNTSYTWTLKAKFNNWLSAQVQVTASTTNGDTTPPVFTITTNTSNPYYSGTGTTVFFRNNGGGAFTVTASDPETGISSANFPAAPSGWTRSPASPTTFATYTHTTGNASVSLSGFSATNGASLSTNYTVTLTLDASNPTQSLTLTPVSGNAVLSGSTIFYKGTSAGSFTLTDTVTDGSSGPASANFPAIGTAGWTHNNETVTTPTGGPYPSSTWSWTASPSNPASKNIVGSDNVGNTVTTATTFTADNTATAPTITFPTSAGRYNATSWTGSITGTATDAGAGVAQTTLTVQRGSDSQFWNGSAWQVASFTLTASGTTSWSQVLAAANLTNGVTYTIVAKTTDNFGNVSPTTTATFTYDTTAPTLSAAMSNGSGSSKITVSGTASHGTGDVLTVTIFMCTNANYVGSGNVCNGTNDSETFTASVNSGTGAYSGNSGNNGTGVWWATVTQADTAGNVGSVTTGPFTR